MKSEKMFTIVDNKCLKVNAFLYFKCFITVCFKSFHAFKFSD